MMDEETAGKLRGLVRRCVLKNVRDDGETQRCSIEVAQGIWRDDVEIMHPFGFAGHAPEDGALGLVLAVGGDEGDLVVLPVSNPSKRMGNLEAGESGLYNAGGDKFVMRAGGAADLKAGAAVNVDSPQVNVTSGQVVILASGSGHLS